MRLKGFLCVRDAGNRGNKITENDLLFFFPGKPALIALVAVAALAVVGLIVAIIACRLHKKKRGAQSISNGK